MIDQCVIQKESSLLVSPMSLKRTIHPVQNEFRSRPIPSRKRRKLEVKARKQGRALGHTGDVDSDALAWRRVQLPGRLDDAEGFYGLEEIEDVEVVKHADGGRISFRPLQSHAVNQDGKFQTEDDWEGFEDEEIPPLNSSVENAGSMIKSNDHQQNESSKTKKKAEIKDREDEKLLSTATEFRVLSELGEESLPDVSAWSELELPESILLSIANLGFTKPTLIQSSAIPTIRRGQDVIGKAVTGSGKTLAFGIPILEMWLKSRGVTENSGPVALILAPTRELSHQLSRHLNELAQGLREQPHIAMVTGGLSVQKQQRQLQNADLVIATPGRLWDVVKENDNLTAKLKRIRFLVIDEADRLLSEGHFKEMEEILDLLDRDVVGEEEPSEPQNHHRQTLVFSATFHKGLQQQLSVRQKARGGDLLSNTASMEYLLKKLNFRQTKPVFIDSSPMLQMAATLKETIIECGSMEKDVYLYAVALTNPQAKILAFANSISSVRRLTVLLQNLGLSSISLHSSMPQKARLRSLEKFSVEQSLLVATDVAARGLDIKNIDLIVHYHVPRTADMYIHRSGRTARAENAGRSILLCSPDEVAGVTRLISKVHQGRAPQVVQIDHGIITRLQPRITLSRKITDATLLKEKVSSRDEWLKNAADELGVDYDSEEFATEEARHSRGRGDRYVKKGHKAGVASKADINVMKAKLRELLSKRVNLGVSERYLAGGKVDVDALLQGRGDQTFLGGSL